MQANFQTMGTFRYGPPLTRKGKKLRGDGGTTEWWLILACDPEIGRYFRRLFAWSVYRAQKLQEPLWGTHVSVVRDERPLRMEKWKSLEGQTVVVSYSIDVQFHGHYACTAVQCEPALNHREELGLPREPAYPLHMTIGNLRRESGLAVGRSGAEGRK